MPSLLDLFRLNADAVKQTPARLQKLPAPPRAPEWDIRSGLPEPGLGQVTPEEWLPPGAGMKLASLAKGLAGKAAIAGTFIGAKHPSWMQGAADEALRLKTQGVDPREIWARTRTFTEHPGVSAIQEIPDARMSLRDRAMLERPGDLSGYRFTPDTGLPVKQVVSHPRLLSGYELGDVPMHSQLGRGIASKGSYDPVRDAVTASGPDSDRIKGTLVHELQHVVQEREGWPKGGSPRYVFDREDTLPHALEAVSEYKRMGVDPDEAYRLAADKTYRRLAGEAQAEAARARMYMTDAQLTQNYPGDSYPVPLKDLLIRR